ncbi:MAG: hypothetical protein KJ818_01705 [Candidatus Omnitrophica bacterium]|nr:hypothetical protein [Candidatus Omnitrophota bacterium]
MISTINKYVGIASSKLILDHLIGRLPEARKGNLNIGRITDFLLKTYHNNKDAAHRIAQFKDEKLAKPSP